MKQSSINNVVKLPSELERQQIFYWLKKLSSLTAWRRIFEYYQAWADVTEKSVRQADNNGVGDDTSLPLAEYALILKCLAHCEEGVTRLSKGDKRIFKFDSHGEFVMAMRMLTHWSQMLQRIQLGENGIKKGTPGWVDFCEALTALAEAWGECGPQILEARYLEDPAPTLYGQWLQSELAKTPFPAQLAPVPDPLDNVFVRTGEHLPCSGIWEPVKMPKPSILNLLTRPPKPQPPFAIQGCMNYLHAGSNAPMMTVETTDDNIDLDTTWRLLWRDDRYSDGTIPEEEAHYVFTKPDKAHSPAPPIWVPTATIWAESGRPAPVAGKWLAETDLRASIMLEKGEILPLHQGQIVRWVLAGA